MKLTKRLLSVGVITVLMCAILAACSIPQTDSTIEIYTTEGAGRIRFETYVDQESIDTIFPAGTAAVAKAVKDKLVAIGIAEADVATQIKENAGTRQLQIGLEDIGGGSFKDLRENRDTDLITIYISFSTIDDYNAKMNKIITMYDGQQIKVGDWDASTGDLMPVDFTSTDLQKTPATFNGATFSAKIASIAKAFDNINAFIYTNPSVCTPEVKEEGGYDNAREWTAFTVKIGDKVTTFDPKTVEYNHKDTVHIDVDLKATGKPSGVIPDLEDVSDEPESKEPESPSEPESKEPESSSSAPASNSSAASVSHVNNPKTGGTFAFASVFAGLTAACLFIVSRKRSR